MQHSFITTAMKFVICNSCLQQKSPTKRTMGSFSKYLVNNVCLVAWDFVFVSITLVSIYLHEETKSIIVVRISLSFLCLKT